MAETRAESPEQSVREGPEGHTVSAEQEEGKGLGTDQEGRQKLVAEAPVGSACEG